MNLPGFDRGQGIVVVLLVLMILGLYFWRNGRLF